MFKEHGVKLDNKLKWTLIIVVFFAIVVVIGKYNSDKNKSSLQYISAAKEYFDSGDLSKAKESFVKIERKGIIDFYPEYKDFYNLMQKTTSGDNNEPIQILGRYDDKFIQNKAYLVINEAIDSKNMKEPFLRIKGWAPQIDTLYPMNIKLEFKDKSVITRTLYQDGSFEIDIPVNDIGNVQNGNIIKLYTDRYYSPKMLGLGDDTRNLSVQLNEAALFDYAEVKQAIVTKGLYSDNWMGRNFDVDILNPDKNIKGIKVSADIPEQIKTPFNIIIRSSTEILQVKRIDHVGKNQIEINFPDEFLSNKVIQISVTSEKVFNPKELGISQDSRDLSLNIKEIVPIY